MSMLQLPWPVRARPKVRSAGLFPLDARGFNYIYRAHVHAIHLHEYSGVIRLAGVDHHLEPGTLTVSPAGQDSSYDLPRPGVHWCIHFDPQPARSAPQLALPLVLRLGTAQGEAVKRFSHITRLRALLAAADGDAPALSETVSVALQELLLWAAVFDRIETNPTSRPTDLVIEQLLDYIDRNLGRKFTADELAEQTGLSQNHLARRFRQRVGTTLPSYVLARRIRLARLLLEGTNLPIKQIAIRVGLPDPHHFNKQFRAISGISPSKFRSNGS